MARETLTDRRLRSLKPAETGKRYDLQDALVPGLGVRVTDKGTVTFTLTTRYPGSTNPTRRALGEYGALTLEQARDKAREWIAQIKKGTDPSKAEQAERDANERQAAAKSERSFETVLGSFIAARRKRGIKKVDEDELDFNRECLPAWKGRPVDEITMADIRKVIEAIDTRGKNRQALNVAQKIGTFFNWCADREIIATSPYRPKIITDAVGKKKPRERVLSPVEIAAFWQATASLDDVYRDVYRVLLMTGQRLNEIAKASWSEIDLEARTLTIPKERNKPGRDHVVPLTDDVLEIIKNVKRFEKSQWVFTLDGKHPAYISDKIKRGAVSKKTGKPTQLGLDGHMLAELRQADPDAKLVPFTNHDLRHTMRTMLSELDVLDEVAEQVIGHAPTAIIRTYNKSQRINQKLQALNLWQGKLREIIGQPPADNVLIFPASA